ncbi:hypothetical protein [Halococcoides cellulosivorans]|uniref:Uncharacterized protein n=1 Tax=Halococcoides cellulosivorans TaxID=1679096 RepID=A0A2R4WZP0_9EURY|nr:hypothetical protein [Halococcoides cellulosivorans]AWB27001.1 hypothetical protein HARCEL1_04390 [Halococcoides cellulosivorans]
MRPITLGALLAWAALVSLVTIGLRYRARGRSQDALVGLRVRMTTLAGAVGAVIAVLGNSVGDAASLWQLTATPLVGVGVPAIAAGKSQVLAAGRYGDYDVDLFTALRAWARYIGGMALILTVLIVPVALVLSSTPLLTSRFGPVVVLALIVAGGLVLETALPYLQRVMVPIRSTDRGAVADGLAAVGRPDLPVCVQETQGNPIQRAYARGVGPTERLYLTDNVLDQTDRIVTATVAMGAARTRTHVRHAGLVVILGVSGAGLSIVTGAPIPALFAFAVGLVAVALRWWAVVRADRIAADALGRDAVTDAIRETTIGSDRSLAWSRRRECLRATPGPARRIDRLIAAGE